MQIENLFSDKLNSPFNKQKWIGRFAPSPTGPLHMGSLAAAVASYMIAKQNKGKWLVRIEDIDKGREVTGAADSILTDLELYGLFWDDEVFYQSKNYDWHHYIIEQLAETGLLYSCTCSRKDLLQRNAGIYDGQCKSKTNTLLTLDEINSKAPDMAVKIDFNEGIDHFDDVLLNKQSCSSAAQKQDFIVKRRDEVFAYQLVVIADDIYQDINHVVRGADILDSTTKQLFLYNCLKRHGPFHYHINLIKDENNLKLSKSLNSPSLKQVEYLQDQKSVIPKSEILLRVFKHLGQFIEPSLHLASPREIIEYYVDNWDTELVTTN